MHRALSLFALGLIALVPTSASAGGGTLKWGLPAWLVSDVNCDGTTDVIDLQISIMVALTGNPPAAQDIDGNGVVDACAECHSALDCDDYNPCTDDYCEGNLPVGAGGYCLNIPNELADGDPCWEGGVCQGGACVNGNSCQACSGIYLTKPTGKVKVNGCVQCISDSGCNDYNACTVDTCSNLGVCSHTPVEEPAACGPGYFCDNGDCVGVTAECDPTLNWTSLGSNPQCYDGLAHTADICVGDSGAGFWCDHNVWAVECVSDADCADGNPCTTENCGETGFCNWVIGDDGPFENPETGAYLGYCYDSGIWGPNSGCEASFMCDNPYVGSFWLPNEAPGLPKGLETDSGECIGQDARIRLLDPEHIVSGGCWCQGPDGTVWTPDAVVVPGQVWDNGAGIWFQCTPPKSALLKALQN